jgi:aspartate-semialdehyde dehydrogenase
MNELREQTKSILANTGQGMPLPGKNVKAKALPCQIAFNIFPHIDVFLDNCYTKEEMKLVHETRKIMEDNSIRITATAVRVPVFIGHSEAVNIETEKNLMPEEAREILSKAPGIIVVDDLSKNEYPIPISSAGTDEVFVGRIRRDESIENGLNLWIVADNLRKGAALNAVQIAEAIISK